MRERIITEEESRKILEDDEVATKAYEDIPVSCWPQMRDSDHMLMSNKKLMECLFEKNYSQISKFLKLMEDIGLTHLLNYFIESGGNILAHFGQGILDCLAYPTLLNDSIQWSY